MISTPNNEVKLAGALQSNVAGDASKQSEGESPGLTEQHTWQSPDLLKDHVDIPFLKPPTGKTPYLQKSENFPRPILTSTLRAAQLLFHIVVTLRFVFWYGFWWALLSLILLIADFLDGDVEGVRTDYGDTAAVLSEEISFQGRSVDFWVAVCTLAIITWVYYRIKFFYTSYKHWETYFKPLPTYYESTIMKHPTPCWDFDQKWPHPMSLRPYTMKWWRYIYARAKIFPLFNIWSIYAVAKFYVIGFMQKQFGAFIPKPEACPDCAELLGFLFLETSLMYWYEGLDDTGKIARFSSKCAGPIRIARKDFWWMDMEEITILVNLETRRAIKVVANGVELSMGHGMLLCGSIIVIREHAWVHSLCAFGWDFEHPDWTISVLSMESAYFSHLGVDGGAPEIARMIGCGEVLTKCGTQATPLVGGELPTIAEGAMAVGAFMAPLPLRNIWRVHELAGHSRFAAFKCLLWPKFKEEYNRVGQEYWGAKIRIHGLWFTSVVHSLDHYGFVKKAGNTTADWTLQIAAREEEVPEMPLDWEAQRKMFALALRLGKDFPRPMRVYFRQLGDGAKGFYKRVYEHAKKIDPELAYNMQACVVR